MTGSQFRTQVHTKTRGCVAALFLFPSNRECCQGILKAFQNRFSFFSAGSSTPFACTLLSLCYSLHSRGTLIRFRRNVLPPGPSPESGECRFSGYLPHRGILIFCIPGAFASVLPIAKLPMYAASLVEVSPFPTPSPSPSMEPIELNLPPNTTKYVT